MCDLKNHNLEVIYTVDLGWNEEHVVKWCKDCGAVVVDQESDGKFFKSIMEMKFPKVLYDFIELKKRSANGSGSF